MYILTKKQEVATLLRGHCFQFGNVSWPEMGWLDLEVRLSCGNPSRWNTFFNLLVYGSFVCLSWILKIVNIVPLSFVSPRLCPSLCPWPSTVPSVCHLLIVYFCQIFSDWFWGFEKKEETSIVSAFTEKWKQNWTSQLRRTQAVAEPTGKLPGGCDIWLTLEGHVSSVRGRTFLHIKTRDTQAVTCFASGHLLGAQPPMPWDHPGLDFYVVTHVTKVSVSYLWWDTLSDCCPRFISIPWSAVTLLSWNYPEAETPGPLGCSTMTGPAGPTGIKLTWMWGNHCFRAAWCPPAG